MRNNTQLPVKWKITGWENLGDDFTLAEDNGVVEPLSEVPLHAYFRAMKPVSTIKKMIRLEVSASVYSSCSLSLKFFVIFSSSWFIKIFYFVILGV